MLNPTSYSPDDLTEADINALIRSVDAELGVSPDVQADLEAQIDVETAPVPTSRLRTTAPAARRQANRTARRAAKRAAFRFLPAVRNAPAVERKAA